VIFGPDLGFRCPNSSSVSNLRSHRHRAGDKAVIVFTFVTLKSVPSITKIIGKLDIAPTHTPVTGFVGCYVELMYKAPHTEEL